MGVESPEILKARDFDKVIIAIRNEAVANKIRDEFAKYIDPKKILLITDVQKGLIN